MSEAAERAEQIKANMTSDLMMRLRTLTPSIMQREALVAEVVDDAMFYIEHLLDEIETLEEQHSRT